MFYISVTGDFNQSQNRKVLPFKDSFLQGAKEAPSF